MQPNRPVKRSKRSYLFKTIIAILMSIIIVASSRLFWEYFIMAQYFTELEYTAITISAVAISETLYIIFTVLFARRKIKIVRRQEMNKKLSDPDFASKINEPIPPPAPKMRTMDDVIRTNKAILARKTYKMSGKLDDLGCDDCGMLFNSLEQFDNHNSIVHGINVQESPTIPKELEPSPPTTTQTKEELENILECKKKELEIERLNVAILSMKRLGKGVNQDTVDVKPAKDLLTADGPQESLVLLVPKGTESKKTSKDDEQKTFKESPMF